MSMVAACLIFKGSLFQNIEAAIINEQSPMLWGLLASKTLGTAGDFERPRTAYCKNQVIKLVNKN